MEQPSSASSSVDPDRIIIQSYEQGNKDESIISVVSKSGTIEDKTCVTFCIKNEDHSIGNALRYIIMRNPMVDFCGYSIPHPSEAKIHFRIQTRDGGDSLEIMKQGLKDLKDVSDSILVKFNESVSKGDYEHHPDRHI